MFGFFYIFTIKYKPMKKILFLLLCAATSYGQIVPTGQEQDFDYGIKNTASQLDDNAAFITVQDATGVQGKSTSSVWAKKIYVDNADATKSFLSTGLIKNGLVTTNADPTKFNITAGIGIITNFDNTDNPTSTIVSFPAFTGITPTYLTSGNITYVAINSSAAVVMQETPFTNIQRRDLIALGAVIHSNLTTINLVNNISAPTNSGTNQLHDLMEAIGALNISGNKYAGNGNLTINKSAGVIFKLGVNFANNWKDPNNLYLTPQTSLTFRYRTQNGNEGLDVTNIDPSVYDLNNVLTAVPVNRFSIQTVTLFQTGQTRIQYGQNTYATMAEAEAAIITRAYVVESNIAANGIARAYIILRHNATDLTNATTSKIIEAQKFGGVASGGVALTDSSIIAALGFTPENVANKSTTLTASDTLYPTNNAILSLSNNLVHKSGTETITGQKTIEGNFGTSGNLFLNNTSSASTYSLPLILQSPNLLVGERTGFTFGRAANPNNRVSHLFYYAGAGSPLNRYAIQFNGGSEIFHAFADGNIVLENNMNPSNDGTNKLQVNGSTKTTALTLTATPTTSAGTYDFVTRNTTAGVVEKVLSNTIATTASPTFTGTPTAPTATVGTNTTQIATTAFVQAANGTFVADAITDGATTIAPSQNAVFDALALKRDLTNLSFIGQIESTSFKGGSLVLPTTGTGLYAPNNGLITFYNNNIATPGWTANTNITATFYKTSVYTVSTLPTTGVVSGTYATVSDATAPTYLGTLTGGGTVVCPVFYNGTAWISH